MVTDDEANGGEGEKVEEKQVMDLSKQAKGQIKSHKSFITRQFTQLQDLRRNITIKKTAPSFAAVAKKIDDMSTKVTSYSGKIMEVYDQYVFAQLEILEEEDGEKLQAAIEKLRDETGARENEFINNLSEFTIFVHEQEALELMKISEGTHGRKENEGKNWRPNNGLKPDPITEEMTPIEFRKTKEGWREFIKEASGGQEVPCSLVLPHLKSTLDVFWRHRLGDTLSDKL